ncbi:Gtr2p [Sporobolomyces koalae]|uniref:Gtr2p n=1 Tax=Sporobolomyces koalae TaxID=500713 RepID=UPI00317B08D5
MITPQPSRTGSNEDVDQRGRRKPRVLLMGPRSGGKSSIRKVVFEGMAPNDTLFIEKTKKSSSEDLNAFLSMRMWDLPGGQLDPEQLNLSFEDTDAVIFVIDAQSSMGDTIRKLSVTMHKAYVANPGIQFEIFLHKVDGMSEDFRLDVLQNLRDRLTEELFDISPELESNMNVFYYLTSVFDNSIYESLSRVIQKLIPEQAVLERLLDLLCQQCSMDKAFIFDTASKIYIATDSAPLDNQTYVLCAEYLDLVGDFTALYEPFGDPISSQDPGTASKARSVSESPARKDSSASTSASHILSASSSTLPSSNDAPKRKGKKGLPHSKVKLGTGSTIAQWTLNDNLSLVALVRPHAQDQHAALIDYNVSTFRQAVLAIFDIGSRGARTNLTDGTQTWKWTQLWSRQPDGPYTDCVDVPKVNCVEVNADDRKDGSPGSPDQVVLKLEDEGEINTVFFVGIVLVDDEWVPWRPGAHQDLVHTERARPTISAPQDGPSNVSPHHAQYGQFAPHTRTTHAHDSQAAQQLLIEAGDPGHNPYVLPHEAQHTHGDLQQGPPSRRLPAPVVDPYYRSYDAHAYTATQNPQPATHQVSHTHAIIKMPHNLWSERSILERILTHRQMLVTIYNTDILPSNFHLTFYAILTSGHTIHARINVCLRKTLSIKHCLPLVRASGM